MQHVSFYKCMAPHDLPNLERNDVCNISVLPGEQLSVLAKSRF
jgi:hypothetical protein